MPRWKAVIRVASVHETLKHCSDSNPQNTSRPSPTRRVSLSITLLAFVFVDPSSWNCLPQSLRLKLELLSSLHVRKRFETFLFVREAGSELPHFFSSFILIASEIQYC